MNSKLLVAWGAALLLVGGARAQSVDTVVTNLFEPHGLASDGTNTYVSDGASGNRIVKFGPDDSVISVAGKAGVPGGSIDDVGIRARFNDPQGLALAQGGLFVADAGNCTLRFIDLTLNTVTTVAGVPGIADSVDGFPGASLLSYPAGLAADAAGNVYIADYGAGAIRVFDTNHYLSTVVSSGVGWPAAVAVGDNGDLWVADAHNSAIYRIDSSGVVSLVGGMPGNTGTNDSLVASEARLNGPRGLLWRTTSGLLISDTGNNTIRRLYYNTNADVLGWSLETVAGVPGIAGNTNTLAPSSLFNGPMGLTPDLYASGFCIADSANKAIRRYRQSSTPVVPVSPPRIGYVIFTLDPSTKTLVSSFVEATLSPVVLHNDYILAIDPEKGTQTLFSFGATPTDAFNDTIPNPATGGISPPYTYQGDGLSPAQTAPSVIDVHPPNLTIKAISQQKGQPPSPLVRVDFEFVVGTPMVVGQNSAALIINDETEGATLWYTLDGTAPTNSSPSLGPIDPGSLPPFPISTNTPLRVRAFKGNFASSDISSNLLYASNYVANRLSFGFETNQEASSQFLGAPGQTFYAPVTLTLMPAQTMYSLQFNVTITNLDPQFPSQNNSFDSMLMKPVGPSYVPIPPMMFDGASLTNLVFANSAISLLGVGWLERAGETNLYDATLQDLITYSIAHDNLFKSMDGKVVVGAYHFKIPDNAPLGSVYQIQLGAVSATADGLSVPALMQLPTNADYSPILSLKQVTLQPVSYLVGSVVPFRWFNAGDFGSNTLQNADVLQIFEAACYQTNAPPQGSDLHDAMDSCNNSITLLNGDDQSINTISNGDGSLKVNDVYVTFRRSLDPTLTNYYRYMSGGARIPVKTNSFLPMPASLARRAPQPAALRASASLSGPHALRIPGADLQAAASQTVQVPITAQILGDLPLRVLMMNLTVEPLDGSPALTAPIQFSEAAALVTSNKLTNSKGTNNYSAAWLDSTVPGVWGTNLLGTLTFTLPDGAGTNAAYLVHFDHFSASPNGLGLFPTTVEDTLITVGDRSGSSWNDTISDAWRLRYFGTVSNLLSAAAADADGDGASNLNEYLAGTNPMDALSKLQVLGPDKGNAAGSLLQWPTVANKQYVIECASSLFDTNWTVLSTNLVGDGSMLQFIDTNSTDSARFYRVRLAP